MPFRFVSRRLVSICSTVVATACFSHAASAVMLYNPALGAPEDQHWLTGSNSTAVKAGVSGGAYRLDTTADPAMSAGSAFSTTQLLPLDTAAGVTLTFSLQVLGETHASDDRSGFSVIAIGSNPADSVELAFWGDRIWAYGASFTHGVEVLYDTSATHTYSLTLQKQQFTLASGNANLLSGSLVDYRPAPNPIYGMANSIYFGDDTSRGASSVALGVVSLSPVPEPATAGLFLLGGALLAVRKRRPAAARMDATK